MNDPIIEEFRYQAQNPLNIVRGVLWGAAVMAAFWVIVSLIFCL